MYVYIHTYKHFAITFNRSFGYISAFLGHSHIPALLDLISRANCSIYLPHIRGNHRNTRVGFVKTDILMLEFPVIRCVQAHERSTGECLSLHVKFSSLCECSDYRYRDMSGK